MILILSKPNNVPSAPLPRSCLFAALPPENICPYLGKGESTCRVASCFPRPCDDSRSSVDCEKFDLEIKVCIRGDDTTSSGRAIAIVRSDVEYSYLPEAHLHYALMDEFFETGHGFRDQRYIFNAKLIIE